MSNEWNKLDGSNGCIGGMQEIFKVWLLVVIWGVEKMIWIVKKVNGQKTFKYNVLMKI